MKDRTNSGLTDAQCAELRSTFQRISQPNTFLDVYNDKMLRTRGMIMVYNAIYMQTSTQNPLGGVGVDLSFIHNPQSTATTPSSATTVTPAVDGQDSGSSMISRTHKQKKLTTTPSQAFKVASASSDVIDLSEYAMVVLYRRY